MNSTPANSSKNKNKYSTIVIERASFALFCSPFCLTLFSDMMQKSIPLPLIAGNSGLNLGYTKKKLPEIIVDSELGWLIQIGLLRREVDGQGLTDSFRLTPLGRMIIDEHLKYSTAFPLPSIWQKTSNFFTRWVRIPT